MSNKIVKILMKLPSSVMLGSKALCVADRDSDTDIAVLKEELDDVMYLFEDSTELPAEKYMNLMPMGNVGLIRLHKLDILIYEKREDLKVVRNCMEILKYLPLEVLAEKNHRIGIFETLLKNRGFKRSSGSEFGF